MALAFLLPVKMMAKASSSDNSTLLWYNAPAQQWLEALPIGNSHLGGMVYGGTTDENIQLNEETFWSGGPHNNNSKKSLENLLKVRELIFNGREEEAAALINQTFIPGPHGMKVWLMRAAASSSLPDLHPRASWHALPADGKSASQNEEPGKG